MSRTTPACPAAGTRRSDGGPVSGRPEHSRNGYDRSVTATGTRAIELVRRAGIDHRVHAYDATERHGRARDARPAYGLEAAEALGVEPDRIYKTLVASVDDRLVLAVVPVAGELDLEAPRRRAGWASGRARRAGGGGAGDRLRHRRDQPARVAAAAPGRPRRRRGRARDDLRVGRAARPPARARPGRPGPADPGHPGPYRAGTIDRVDTALRRLPYSASLPGNRRPIDRPKPKNAAPTADLLSPRRVPRTRWTRIVTSRSMVSIGRPSAP